MKTRGVHKSIAGRPASSGDGTQSRLRQLAEGEPESDDEIVLRPNGVSTTRYDDVARLAAGRHGLLLDVGCGSGRLLRGLAGQFSQSVGVDISSDRLFTASQKEVGTTKEHVAFAAASAEIGLPFRTGSFDVVIACAVLEHLLDVFSAVEEFARVCRTDGVVFITVPNLAYVKHLVALVRGRVPLTGTDSRDLNHWQRCGWDGGHLHYFTPNSLRELLEMYGLVVEATTGDGSFARIRRVNHRFVGGLTVRARKTNV